MLLILLLEAACNAYQMLTLNMQEASLKGFIYALHKYLVKQVHYQRYTFDTGNRLL